jgi:hypothetical protein
MVAVGDVGQLRIHPEVRIVGGICRTLVGCGERAVVRIDPDVDTAGRHDTKLIENGVHAQTVKAAADRDDPVAYGRDGSSRSVDSYEMGVLEITGRDGIEHARGGAKFDSEQEFAGEPDEGDIGKKYVGFIGVES